MSMMWMRMPGQTWLGSAAMFILMWLAMMVAMMLPSIIPVLLNFRRSLVREGTRRAGVSTALVACGYFTVWTAIGGVAYILGVSWALATMRWSVLSSAVPALTGATLVLAGGLQFTRWKMAGLGHCRNPHIDDTIKRGSELLTGWLHGCRQGIFCGICCAGPMLALLVLGTMNLFFMTAVAGVIALEKLFPRPKPVVFLTGILAIVAGTAILVRALF